MDRRPLVLYRNFRYQELYNKMAGLLLGDGDKNQADAYACAGQLVQLAADYGFQGNLWHCFLALCLANHENAYSVSCEIRGDMGGTLSALARQDFQIGKSQAESIYCPAVRTNLKGKRVKFSDDDAPLPLIATELGYSIYWNTPGFGYIDDTPGREVKKPGDVTFSSPSTTAIDYYFIVK